MGEMGDIDQHQQAHDATHDQQPLFSVVMPAYNVERYLGAAIESVRAQTCDSWELIIVDDASTDDTLRIAQEAAQGDARIRVLHHQHNQWVSAARNTGIAHACGRYLWMCDPDDTYSPDLLQACERSLASHAADVVVFGHVEKYYDAHGKFLYDHEIAPQAGAYDSPERLRPHIMPLEIHTSYGYPWNKVYRLDLLRQHDVQFKRGDFVEDITFNIEVFNHVQSMNVLCDTLYFYAKRQDANITNEFDPCYFVKHRARIQMLRDQQEAWGLLDDTVRSQLGSLLGRYILSALSRNSDKRSGMSTAQQRSWCEQLFDDPLFNELIPLAQPEESGPLEACLIALKDKRVKGCVRLGKVIHAAQSGSTTLFTKVKSLR